jgi:two-component system response regulator
MQSYSAARRLLVIEDNPTDTFLLRRALNEHNVEYEMVVVEDGEQGIEYLESCRDEARPDLIIVDLNLPKEDGIEVLKRFRESPSFVQTQIVILTSSDSPMERQRAEALGISAYLQKPIDLDAFMEMGGVLRKLLEQQPALQSA